MKSRIILFPYWLALKARHSMYDHSFIKKETKIEGISTISIGNVVAGGTGKTPHTEMLLRMLAGHPEFRNLQTAVLSRGYKRSSKGFQEVAADSPASFAGDEPLQIKKKFPGAVIAVDKNRVEACRRLKDKGMKLVILDDSMQYRKLRPDFSIALTSYSTDLSKEELLPMGRLRDLPQRMDTADIIIVSKCPSDINHDEMEAHLKTLGLADFNTADFTAVNRKGKKQTVLFTDIKYLPFQTVFPEGEVRYDYAKTAIMFSGIANDNQMRRYLADKYRIVKRIAFPDHHSYSKADIRKVAAAAKDHPTAAIFTTEKDAQRLLDCKKIPLDLKRKIQQVPIEVNFTSEEQAAIFMDRLSAALLGK